MYGGLCYLLSEVGFSVDYKQTEENCRLFNYGALIPSHVPYSVIVLHGDYEIYEDYDKRDWGIVVNQEEKYFRKEIK